MLNRTVFAYVAWLVLMLGLLAIPSHALQTITPTPTSQGQLHSNISTVTASADVPITWKTYNDPIFGFSIDYPSVVIVEDYEQVIHQWTVNYDPLCNSYTDNRSFVICFYLPEQTNPLETSDNKVRASLSISTTNLEQNDCLSFTDVFTNSGLQMEGITHSEVNGIKLSIFEAKYTRSPGFGWGNDVRSRAFIGHTCFEIATQVRRWQYLGTIVGTVTPAVLSTSDPQYDYVQALFDHMLKTLRFTMPQTSSTSTESKPAALTPSPTSVLGWETYTNSAFGFSFDYPSMMHLMNYVQVKAAAGLAYLPLCDFETADGSLVICAYLPPETTPDTTKNDFSGASIAISTLNLGEQACTPVDSGKQETRVINGIRFVTNGEWGGGEMQKRIWIIGYNAFTHNTCIGITISVEEELDSQFFPDIKPFTDDNKQHVQAILDRVLSSFRFVS